MRNYPSRFFLFLFFFFVFVLISVAVSLASLMMTSVQTHWWMNEQIVDESGSQSFFIIDQDDSNDGEEKKCSVNESTQPDHWLKRTFLFNGITVELPVSVASKLVIIRISIICHSSVQLWTHPVRHRRREEKTIRFFDGWRKQSEVRLSTRYDKSMLLSNRLSSLQWSIGEWLISSLTEREREEDNAYSHSIPRGDWTNYFDLFFCSASTSA